MDTKTKIIIILSLLIIVISTFGYLFYTSQIKDEKIKENQQIIDSLQKSLNTYKKKNDSLNVVAATMENLLQNQEVKVIKVKESFIVYKTQEIQNSSDAYKYINKFISE
jgi:hypothetical protein